MQENAATTTLGGTSGTLYYPTKTVKTTTIEKYTPKGKLKWKKVITETEDTYPDWNNQGSFTVTNNSN